MTVPPFPGHRDTSRYRVRGERVPSVTEVLSLAGLAEFPGIRRDVLENAANRGKWAHHFCELIDHGQAFDEADVPEEVRPRLDAYRAFLAETRFEPSEVEHVVVSQIYRVAGTVDLIGHLPGVGCVLIDRKLPTQESPAWQLQTMGYAFALAEQTGIHPQRRYSLRLHKNGRYALTPHNNDAHDLTDFLAALNVAHFKLRNGLAQLAE